ncbi:MAG: hypothetical protein VYB72_02790, partial [Planctomycetota bacterium]|nr:hypothetical protein [Planctomycetota bacterium]
YHQIRSANFRIAADLIKQFDQSKVGNRCCLLSQLILEFYPMRAEPSFLTPRVSARVGSYRKD